MIVCSKLHWCSGIVTWQSLLSSCKIGGGRLWSTRRCHKVGTVCQWQALSPCKQANGGQIFVFVKLVNGQWSLEELSNQTDMLKRFWRLGPGLECIGWCLKFSVKIFPTVSHVVKFHYFAVYKAEILMTNRLKKKIRCSIFPLWAPITPKVYMVGADQPIVACPLPPVKRPPLAPFAPLSASSDGCCRHAARQSRAAPQAAHKGLL